MTLTRYRLGDLIEIVDEKNDLGIRDFYGININKEIMPTNAKTENLNEKKYKLLRKNRFVYSGMQTGRDKSIRISMYFGDEPVIVSPAYTTFEIKDENIILPIYFFMLFQSKEKDRLGWFYSDSSVRANLDWDRFCDIKIDLPPLDIQKKYVAIYKAMLENQAAYEKGLGDLKLACDVSLDNLAQNSDFKKIGTFIKRNNLRNSDVSFTIDDVKGFNNVGEFIKPMRLFSGDISKFKIIKNNYFVYNSRINSNIKRLSIALNLNQSLLVSPAYETFYVSNEKELNSSYLYMLLQQDIFARKVLYNSFGSSTLVFGFNELCDIKIPVPNIKEQIYISNIFESYKNRYKINEKLKERLKNICPILIKGAVEEAKRKEA